MVFPSEALSSDFFFLSLFLSGNIETEIECFLYAYDRLHSLFFMVFFYTTQFITIFILIFSYRCFDHKIVTELKQVLLRIVNIESTITKITKHLMNTLSLQRSN